MVLPPQVSTLSLQAARIFQILGVSVWHMQMISSKLLVSLLWTRSFRSWVNVCHMQIGFLHIKQFAPNHCYLWLLVVLEKKKKLGAQGCRWFWKSFNMGFTLVFPQQYVSTNTTHWQMSCTPCGFCPRPTPWGKLAAVHSFLWGEKWTWFQVRADSFTP